MLLRYDKQSLHAHVFHITAVRNFGIGRRNCQAGQPPHVCTAGESSTCIGEGNLWK